jgi:bifunctional non-homologous end joining protein LigD
MLAMHGDLPRDGANWAFEYKWDGVRAIAYWAGDELRLQSRNMHDITARYGELWPAPRQLGARQAVFDGEIVALDPAGRPDFGRLQQRMGLSGAAAQAASRHWPVQFYVFDLLWRDGESLVSLPYKQRRAELEGVSLAHPRWRLTPSHPGAGEEMLAAARQVGLEGLIAKRLASMYQPGRRSGDWIKIKIVPNQEFVVGGWEVRRQSPQEISSLLVGFYDASGTLRFAGRVGTGFAAQTHRRLRQLLDPLAREHSPFADCPRARGIRHVQPVLVAQVEYRRWPAGGQLQQASFAGLRDDKDPREVIIERS